MIDTHCHLTYKPLNERVDEVLARAIEAGVDRMITVGTSPEDARKAAELAEKYGPLYSTVGIHPHYAAEYRDRGMVEAVMEECIKQAGCVGFGEMGLDCFYDKPALEEQRRVLEWQLEVVAELGGDWPVVIHNREATDLTLEMLRGSGIVAKRFVFHCFTGSEEELEKVLAFGAMVGFTGIITFKNAAGIAECAVKVPGERLLVETDSPYLTPEPHRKVRPNEPKYVVDVARYLSEKRGMGMQEFVEMVDRNAVRFFGLG